MSPHPVLVAHPATTTPETDAVSAPTPDIKKLTCTVSSLGLELENYPVRKCFKHVAKVTMTDLWNYYGDLKKIDLQDDSVMQSLMRRFLEEHP